MGTGKFNPNRSKKNKKDENEPKSIINNGPFKCKGCDAYTFGAPIRRNNQNFCEYCIEKMMDTGSKKEKE